MSKADNIWLWGSLVVIVLLLFAFAVFLMTVGA